MTNSDATCRFQDRRPGFQCLTGQALGYLAEVCQLVADVSARRLRSADTATCVTHRKSNIFGDRCFAAVGPRLWNSLPINLRQCHSLEQFKRLCTSPNCANQSQVSHHGNISNPPPDSSWSYRATDSAPMADGLSVWLVRRSGSPCRTACGIRLLAGTVSDNF